MNRLRKTLSHTSAQVGLVLLVFVLAVAGLGRFVAPYSPTEPITAPGAGPGPSVLGTGYLILGSDYLGRDVLSRVLNGGLSVIAIGLSATLLAYLIGVGVGLLTGSVENRVSSLTMRVIDVIISFPPLLVLLLLVGGFGSKIWVLILGVIIVLIPGITRVTRAAAATVAKSSYVEVARTRGDGTMSIWRRDLLPNILPVVLADFGVRFGLSIILVASMNYLGLGLAPPASDWGLMTSENQSLIGLNPWSVGAPAMMLALLTISVNLLADAYVKTLSGREGPRNPWWARRGTKPPMDTSDPAVESTVASEVEGIKLP
jgi:peptide/nickel transport system permease protein